jgi:hypothetical protein
MYNELQKLNTKEQTTQFKKWRNELNMVLKRSTNANKYTKKCSTSLTIILEWLSLRK